jgi:hypothetical protein
MSKFRFRPADDCLLPLHPQIQPAILRPSESLIGVLLCKNNLMLCYATTHGLLFLHDLASISLAANGSIRPNARQMAPLSAIRLVLLPRGSINSKALTLMRPLVRLLKHRLSGLFFLSLARMGGRFVNLMSAMHSYMVISLRRYI